MRIIKFRAWDLEFKKMWLPHHVVFHQLECKKLNQHQGIDIFMSQEEYHLMQFTGLKDKNGIEIYDGDIVKDEFNRVLQIIWSSDEETNFARWDFEVIHSDINFITDEINLIKIIGNIYENPELLNKGVLT